MLREDRQRPHGPLVLIIGPDQFLGLFPRQQASVGRARCDGVSYARSCHREGKQGHDDVGVAVLSLDSQHGAFRELPDEEGLALDRTFGIDGIDEIRACDGGSYGSPGGYEQEEELHDALAW